MKRHLLSFKQQQSYFTLPQWKWPHPGDYGGSAGAERVRGWQIKIFLLRNAWLGSPAVCSVTGQPASVYHNEDYLAPWQTFAVSRATHLRIHQRFRHTANWLQFLRERALPGSWACSLSCSAVPVVSRSADEFKRHIVATAPFPQSVAISWLNLFRDDEHPALNGEMSDAEVERFIASNSWKFASSLAHIPHEYVTRARCHDQFEFQRLVLWIRRIGVRRRFGSSYFVYLDFHDGWSYFSCGNCISSTTVLNRSRTPKF